MYIRKTTWQDIDHVMEVYAYARGFMTSHGNPNQWSNSNWPPQTLIEQDITNGKSYVCLSDDGQIIGVFYYTYGENAEEYYRKIENGSWARNSDLAYGVVHRIATDGTKGVGSFCLNWAFEQCGYLRIDTHADNYVMQNLLKKLSFVHRGSVHVPEDDTLHLAYDKIQ